MTNKPAVIEQPPLAMEPVSDEPTSIVSMIGRLATNPNVSVDVLERLMEMHERHVAAQAKAAFDDAFAEMQKELPVIVEQKKADKHTYAPLEDIVQIVRPILAKHGFSLSHRTEWPDAGMVKIVGILAHRLGHEKQSEFLSAADSSGSKNAIQGLGSAISYGRRYTTTDLLNIVTRGQDDDAKRSAMASAPEGYDDWMWQLSDVADKGLNALQAAWRAGKAEYRERLNKVDGQAWAQFKARAAKVSA